MAEPVQNIILAGIGTVAGIVAITPPIMGLATTVGTFFAPHTAAAGGGAINIIAASTAGSALTFIPSTFGLIFAGLLLTTGLNIRSSSLISIGILCGLIDIVATYCLAAKLGASIVGVTSSSVLLCNMIGTTVALLGVALSVGLVVVGLAALGSTFIESLSPGALSGNNPRGGR
jgi:hypothetical protein